MRAARDACGSAQEPAASRRWPRIILALVGAASVLQSAVGFAQQGGGEEEPTSGREVGRLRLASMPAPWPHWPPSAIVCQGEIFVAAQHVYVSRDGRQWRHAHRGLPQTYAAVGVDCVDDTAFLYGYPALIARWESDARRWEVEHVVASELEGPIDYWPAHPYFDGIAREWTADGERLRGMGEDGVNRRVQVVRRTDGSWDRAEPWSDWRSMVTHHCVHHCESGYMPIRTEGAAELCGGPSWRLLVWRSPVAIGACWPEPEQVEPPPPPPDSGYDGAWWSPNSVLLFGPRIHERPWRDQDRSWTHQYVTLRSGGTWRRAVVRGLEEVAGPVELGSSTFLFTSHRIYRVIEPRQG